MMRTEQIVGDTPEHCVLGLEAYTIEGSEQKKNLMEGSIQTVLADQAGIREEALLRHIPQAERDEMLAIMYREYSRQAMDAAQARAIQTAMDVEEINGVSAMPEQKVPAPKISTPPILEQLMQWRLKLLKREQMLLLLFTILMETKQVVGALERSYLLGKLVVMGHL